MEDTLSGTLEGEDVCACGFEVAVGKRGSTTGQASIRCENESCGRVYHPGCVGVEEEYKKLKKGGRGQAPWECPSCDPEEQPLQRRIPPPTAPGAWRCQVCDGWTYPGPNILVCSDCTAPSHM